MNVNDIKAADISPEPWNHARRNFIEFRSLACVKSGCAVNVYHHFLEASARAVMICSCRGHRRACGSQRAFHNRNRLTRAAVAVRNGRNNVQDAHGD